MTWDADTAVADAACCALIGSGVTRAEPLSATSNAAVFRVTLAISPRVPVILKLYPARARRRASRELEAMRALAGARRFRVPEIVAAGPLPEQGLRALLLTDLGPLTLGHAIRDGTRPRQSALLMTGRLLASLHRQRTPSTGHALGQHVHRLLDRLPGHLRRAARGRLVRLADFARDHPPVQCHGDLHFDNIVLLPGEPAPGVVDFEQVTTAPAEYDLAQTAVTSDATAPGDQAMLLSGYASEVSPDLLAELIVFHTLRGWYWAGHREGRDRPLWLRRLTQLRLQGVDAHYPSHRIS